MVPMLCECLSILTLDFVIKAKKKYYPQALSEVWTKKDRNGEPYWWWFRKSLYDKSDNDSDNDSDDESNE